MADTRESLAAKVSEARQEASTHAPPALVYSHRSIALIYALAERLSISPTEALEDALQRRLDDLPAPEPKPAPEGPAAVPEPRVRAKLKATDQRLEGASRKPFRSKLRR